MPGDPYINEEGCIYMLQQAVNAETLPYHQNAALQVIMDLYDRKATREDFAKSAGTAIVFYSTLAKLYVIGQTKALHADGSLDAAMIAGSEAKLTEIATEKAAALVKVMSLLSCCATSQDAVH